MTTIKTQLVNYFFNLDVPEEKIAYNQLRKSLSKTNGKCFEVLADPKSKECPIGDIEIETDYLFSNQWNTAPVDGCNGYRVFDWYQAIYHNKKIKSGHYLVITDEMREIRRNTLVCGYCGKYEPAATGLLFCEKCLDSEYLKETELHLTRLLPVELHFPTRQELTEAERARILPEYVRRQTTGANSRNANKLRKQRAKIIIKQNKTIDQANEEANGMLWLMDHDVSIDNVIYYNHTQKFCFGWRQPVATPVLDQLMDLISEFPFAYEIKSETRNYKGY